MNKATNIFSFSYNVLIGDLNYGQHVGADALSKILHEARVRFLHFLGAFSEVSVGNSIGLIMRSLSLQFKKQLFYGDSIRIEIRVSHIKKTQFTLLYHVIKDSGREICNECESNFTFFNYEEQKLSIAPPAFLEALTNYTEKTDGNKNSHGG